MKSDYFVRKEKRLDKFKELADKNAKLSVNLSEQASKMASVIPFGQPILVGHHSEKRDRNYRNKIHNTFGRSVEASNKSDYYENRVAAAESNHAISSDNPDAVKLLEEKLEGLQATQELYKGINKIMKMKKLNDVEKSDKLMALGMNQKTANLLVLPDQFGRVGIPSYKLTNNNGNMKRIKDRIKQLEKRATLENKEINVGAVRIFGNVDENRVQIFFPWKPAEMIRIALKADGFKWAPTEGAWQRMYSNWAMTLAENIVRKFDQSANQ